MYCPPCSCLRSRLFRPVDLLFLQMQPPRGYGGCRHSPAAGLPSRLVSPPVVASRSPALARRASAPCVCLRRRSTDPKRCRLDAFARRLQATWSDLSVVRAYCPAGVRLHGLCGLCGCAFRVLQIWLLDEAELPCAVHARELAESRSGVRPHHPAGPVSRQVVRLCVGVVSDGGCRKLSLLASYS